MKYSTISLLAMSFTILCQGCARVTFHDSPDSKKQTSLKIYYPKTYLLVTYTGAKDAPVKTEIIQIADKSKPLYARYHPGWGSHNYTIGFNTNGTISTYGQTTDSKGPETINAIGGFVSNLGAAYKAVGEGEKARKESKGVDEAAANLQTARRKLTAIAFPDPPNALGVFGAKKDDASRFLTRLNAAASAIEQNAAGQVPVLKQLSKDIGEAMIKNAGESESAKAINDNFDNAKAQIDLAVGALEKAEGRPEPVPKPDFKIFEIKNESGITSLVEITSPELKAIVNAARQ